MEDYYKWAAKLRIKHSNSAPYLCQNCGHDKTTSKVMGTINYDVCEEEYYCAGCKTKVGFWAYGHYEI
jgi:predicted SprT family Zn-dependent metalloprotease